MLAALDAYLEILQKEHLRAVAEAGSSRPDVPRAT